jgi:hypothetical protein
MMILENVPRFRVLVLSALLFLALPSGIARADDSCSGLLARIKTKLYGWFVTEKSVESAPTMTKLLESKLPTDPEVIRLFVRFPNTNTMPNYVNNMIRSTQMVFAPWYRREFTEPYADMLRKQHWLLTWGQTGEEMYLSTSLYGPLTLEEIGMFRHELPPISPAELRFPFAEKLGGLDKHPEPVAAFLKTIKPGEVRWVSLTEVPRMAHPRASVLPKVYNNETTEVLFTQFYPAQEHTQFYVNALEKIMLELRDLPHPSPLETLVPRLASTIKLFSIGLPFKKVNFSIAMSHVNFILMEHGYRGIENGLLDIYSMLLPEETFHALLLDTIRKAQP